ncbi:hypothetical protein, variant [Fonticula alba]|nr:hypothetical protein, variant [Fonticula alba]KCV72858.1 hypothetical protein, variant [Fonticula alba]|eukprot:XP_009492559.1 hypothetical protein, variant [Fonticula alba]
MMASWLAGAPELGPPGAVALLPALTGTQALVLWVLLLHWLPGSGEPGTAGPPRGAEWQHYLASLPSSESFLSHPAHPQVFPQARRRLPLGARRLVAGVHQRLQQDLARLSAVWTRPELPDDLFAWAWFCVNTRCVFYSRQSAALHRHGPPSEECQALAPVLDWLNHHPLAHLTTTTHIEPRGGALTIRTTTTTTTTTGGTPEPGLPDPGALHRPEVFISYGPHSDGFLLAEYGFVPPSSVAAWAGDALVPTTGTGRPRHNADPLRRSFNPHDNIDLRVDLAAGRDAVIEALQRAAAACPAGSPGERHFTTLGAFLSSALSDVDHSPCPLDFGQYLFESPDSSLEALWQQDYLPARLCSALGTLGLLAVPGSAGPVLQPWLEPPSDKPGGGTSAPVTQHLERAGRLYSLDLSPAAAAAAAGFNTGQGAAAPSSKRPRLDAAAASASVDPARHLDAARLWLRWICHRHLAPADDASTEGHPEQPAGGTARHGALHPYVGACATHLQNQSDLLFQSLAVSISQALSRASS